MFRKTVERSQIEVMLYSFVDEEVPESVQKLEYLVRLGRRRICGNAVMQPSGIGDWIARVKEINIDEESRKFVEKLEDTLPALEAEL